MDFGNYISAIYPPELQLTDTSTSSTEVCCLVTNIKTGGTNTPFHISIYDERDDFTFWLVNFPHMESNIPANPAYGVYISQLVRYARIYTSKVDFMNRLRGLSLRLRQQGFLPNLLQRTFTKFFNRHGLIVNLEKMVRREIDMQVNQVNLGYNSNESKQFHTFVANCVAAIQEVASSSQWQHVGTLQNAADGQQSMA